MPQPNKPSPTELPILFEIDPQPAPEILTALGEPPLLVRVFRAVGVPWSVKQHLHLKQRQRGYDEAVMTDSLVMLNAAGGDGLDDLERLRAAPGLAEMLGHEIPSPEAGRKFLYQFHDAGKMEEAKQQLKLRETAYIPGENAALQGLGQVNRDLIQALGQRCTEPKIATVDQDATIIESRKREGLPTYTGEQGYQPMLAVWAETHVILVDEFRDGSPRRPVFDFQPAEAPGASCGEGGLAPGHPPGAFGGMDRRLQATALGDLRRGVLIDGFARHLSAQRGSGNQVRKPEWHSEIVREKSLSLAWIPVYARMTAANHAREHQMSHHINKWHDKPVRFLYASSFKFLR